MKLHIITYKLYIYLISAWGAAVRGIAESDTTEWLKNNINHLNHYLLIRTPNPNPFLKMLSYWHCELTVAWKSIHFVLQMINDNLGKNNNEWLE